jgi:hypothetical protein
MKTVFSSKEVAHIWAQNNQKEGRNSAGNIYFRNGEIYSYGSHFCMGKILPSGIVLITNRAYSNTTSKHLSHVWRSVSHRKPIRCAYPERSIQDNLRAFQSDMKSQYEIILAPRKRQATKDIAALQIAAISENVDSYLAAMGTSFTAFSLERNVGFEEIDLLYAFAKQQDLSLLSHGFERLTNERSEREKAAKEKARKELKAKVSKWLKGERVSIYGCEDVLLRNVGENVETSMGAQVPLKEAEILFRMAQTGKDVKGHQIGYYTVISLNGVLTIGCHKIERKEINRFAKKMGWGQIPN